MRGGGGGGDENLIEINWKKDTLCTERLKSFCNCL